MDHGNETEDSQKLLTANAEAFKLNKAQSMVSLGPGKVEDFFFFLIICFPNLFILYNI